MTSTVPSARTRRGALIDVHRRARSGALVYVVGWLAMLAEGELLRAQTAFVVVVSTLLAATALARVVLHQRFAALIVERESVARTALRALVLAGGLQMGCLAAASLHWQPLVEVQSLVILVSAVACASASTGLAMDQVIRLGTPAAVLAPFVAGLCWGLSVDELPTLLLVVLFAAYLIRTTTYIHDDYWQAAETVAIQHRRAAELELLSTTDTLTGLANRLSFDQRLEETWAYAARNGGFLAILIIDLDHFKRINDSHGHPVGDRCLQAAADAIAAHALRLPDLAARYGGEEFAVLLPGAAQHAAVAIAERIRTAISEIIIEHDGDTITMTCSIGVSSSTPFNSDRTCAAALTAADTALYDAKQAGRDCVHAASSGE